MEANFLYWGEYGRFIFFSGETKGGLFSFLYWCHKTDEGSFPTSGSLVKVQIFNKVHTHKV